MTLLPEEVEAACAPSKDINLANFGDEMDRRHWVPTETDRTVKELLKKGFKGRNFRWFWRSR